MSVSLINLLLASLGLFVLFKFVLLPFTTQVALNDSSPSALKKYIIRNIVDLGGLLFLLITISSGIVWLIIEITNAKGGATLEEVNSSLEFVKQIDIITAKLANDWAIVTTLLLSFALIILTYKSTKKSFEEKISIASSKGLEKLQEEYNEGKWEDLPPTKEMQNVYDLLQEYSNKINELNEVAETEEDIALLNNWIENKDNLIAYLEQLDIQRRITIEIEDDPYPKPVSLKDKILVFFVSQGLMTTLRKGGVLLFIIGILLLIPSLLSVGSDVVNTKIQTQMTQLSSKLEKLELEVQFKEVADEFNKIVVTENNNSKESLSSEDEKVLDELSQVFENNIVATRIAGNALVHTTRSIANGITNHSVRSTILDEFATADNKVKVHTSKELPALMKNAVQLEKKAIANNGPVTDLGQRIKQDLREVAKNNKDLWSHYKQVTLDATKSFQIPASARDVKGMMISNVVGHLTRGVTIPGDMGKVTGKLSVISADVAERFYLNESRRYMVELAKSKNINDVVNKIGKVEYRPLPKQHLESLQAFSNNIAKEGKTSKMSQHPPSLSVATESHVKMSKAQVTVSNIAKANNSLGSRTTADALSSFADYFPGYAGEERQTAKGKTTAKTSSSGGYSSKAAVTRSRSYGKLRGFSRIGGVLIGRMPTEDKTLDVVDITWEKKEDRYELVLVFKDGKKISIGAFNPAILHLALGYVADGRVTTITMVSSEPLYDLRILLHPALIDTGLGCSAIKLDQIADITTSENEKLKKLRGNENLRIANARIIYSFAWAERLKRIAANDSSIAGEVTNYLTYADDIISSYSGKIQKILTNESYNLNFITEKTDFYDKELVEIIQKCKNNQDYKKCIGDNSPIFVSTDNPTWLYPPAKTTEWSGVREIEYTMDKELNFLLASEHDELWPFRFMVQTVFTSDPDFAKEKEGYSDSNPWEFKAVNELLKKKITKSLAKNKEHKTLIRNMKEFAILQRLFRVALNNKFSEEFPVEKLAILAKETKSFLSGYQRTLRWLPKPGALEQVTIRALLQQGNNEKVKNVLALKKQLRNELGIAKDEKQIRDNDGKECPQP